MPGPATRSGRSFPTTCCRSCKTLCDGQPVEQFDYFVDSSPKIAEVKIERRVAQPAAHRRRDRAARSTRRSTSPRPAWASPRTPTVCRRSARCSRSSTRRTSRSCSSGRSRTTRSFDPTYTATFTVTGRHARAARSKLFGDLEGECVLRREDRRLHLVGPGRRSARCRPARPTPSSSGRATSRISRR